MRARLLVTVLSGSERKRICFSMRSRRVGNVARGAVFARQNQYRRRHPTALEGVLARVFHGCYRAERPCNWEWR